MVNMGEKLGLKASKEIKKDNLLITRALVKVNPEEKIMLVVTTVVLKSI